MRRRVQGARVARLEGRDAHERRGVAAGARRAGAPFLIQSSSEVRLFNDKSILITGGTGSFGKRYVATLLARYRPRRLIVYSRDELKQFEMQQEFNADCMRYFIGDVRDRERLVQAMNGVDYVI